MAYINQTPNGEIYVYRRGSLDGTYIVKYNTNIQESGQIGIKNINFPKELVGKRIRLKVEVIED